MNDKRIKICHFSDLHLAPDQQIPLWKCLNKRALGYANLKFNRGKTHRLENLQFLLRQVARESADWVIVTGDFTSLAFSFEFEKIHHLFIDAGLSPQNTLIIPGNHDRYTIRADYSAAFERGMSAWMPPFFSRKTGYPITIDAGPIRLIGMDTAVWQNPIRAAGAISNNQLERLSALLTREQLKGRWPVIAMHHPPFDRGQKHRMHYRTGLCDYQRFLDTIPCAATVLHGHMHVLSRKTADNIDIIGVSSASNDTGKPKTQLAYHTYVFEKDGLVDAHVNRIQHDGANRFSVATTPLPSSPY